MTDPMTDTTTTRDGDVLTEKQLPSPKIINEYIRQMAWEVEQDELDGQRETTVLTHRLSDVLASHRALTEQVRVLEGKLKKIAHVASYKHASDECVNGTTAIEYQWATEDCAVIARRALAALEGSGESE